MREQISDRDTLTISAAPLRQPVCHEVIEGECSGIDGAHRQRRRGNHLGQRRKIEDRLVGRGSGIGQVRQSAKRFAPEDLAPTADFDDGGGKGVRRDRGLEKTGGGRKSDSARPYLDNAPRLTTSR